MESDSRPKNWVSAIKQEISKLVEAISEEPLIHLDRLEVQSVDQIKNLAKDLLEDRRRYNLELEKIKQEMDELVEQLESLKLVGADSKDPEIKINHLSEKGQEYSMKLEQLEAKLKEVRRIESILGENIYR